MPSRVQVSRWSVSLLTHVHVPPSAEPKAAGAMRELISQVDRNLGQGVRHLKACWITSWMLLMFTKECLSSTVGFDELTESFRLLQSVANRAFSFGPTRWAGTPKTNSPRLYCRYANLSAAVSAATDSAARVALQTRFGLDDFQSTTAP